MIADKTLPVVDKLGEHLQLAHELYAQADYSGAAQEIRAGAEFLTQEQSRVGREANRPALEDAVKNLDKLATAVEQNKVSSVEALNIAFRDAYQADLNLRLSEVSAQELSSLVELPARHFVQALDAFKTNDTQTAATEIRKALALVRVEASGPSKLLEQVGQQLEKLGQELETSMHTPQ